jgi:glycosyltransferase involved in cell wall biosynthesis
LTLLILIMNLTKYKVVGDPNNPPRFSSSIIIDSLNEGAKKLGLYDENGAIVVYDCISNQHGYNADAIILCYEMPGHQILLQNSQGKPVIAVSRDNMSFLIETGFPKEKVDYINLGVDSKLWKPIKKEYLLDKYVVGCYTESLVRSGLEILVEAFGTLYGGDSNKILYIKDRNATPKFAEWIKEQSTYYNVDIIYNNCHLDTIEKEIEIFKHFDCHVNLNRSSTWFMPLLQSLSLGIPTASMCYSGPREYISDMLTGLEIDYDLEFLTNESLKALTDIGMRNFFFPVDNINYRQQPYWASPKIESVKEVLIKLESSYIRSRLSFLGRSVAETLNWERSSLNLSYVLSKFGIKK